MSDDQSFEGDFEFADGKTAAQAVADFAAARDSVVEPRDLVLEGCTVRVRVDASAPASWFDSTCDAIGKLGASARAGAVIATFGDAEDSDSAFSQVRLLPGGAREDLYEDDAETLLVYRPCDHGPLAAMLPEGAGIRDCLFWVAPDSGGAIDALLASIPEPECEHVEEGMKLASLVGELAGRSRLLAELLRPDDVSPGQREYFGTYSLGFHAGSAEQVEAWLRQRGHRVLPLGTVFDHVAILRVRDARGQPATSLSLRRVLDGEARCDPLLPGVDGHFVLEVEDLAGSGLALVGDNGEELALSELPAPGWAFVQLGAVATESDRAADD